MNLILLSINNFLFFLFIGLHAVLFPFILKENSLSETFIGLSGTIEISAGIFIAAFIPKIVKKIGAHITIYLATIIASLTILLIPFYVNYFVWCIYILLIGTSWFSFVVIKNAWFNEVVEDKIRGKIAGIISLSASIGAAASPFMLKLISPDNYHIFILASFIGFLSLIPILFIKKKPESVEISLKLDLLKHLKKAPISHITSLTIGLVIAPIWVLAIIYGMKNGFKYENAAFLLSAFMMSSIFDMVSGIFSDLHSRKFLTFFGLIISAIAFFILIFFGHNFYLVILLFFIIGLGFGLTYVARLALLNNAYSKKELVHANLISELMANIGGIIGTLIVGIAMDFGPRNSFPIVCFSFILIYFLLMWKFRAREC